MKNSQRREGEEGNNVGIVDMVKTKNILPDLVKHAEFNLLII
jgi:hypothetical protein